VLLHLAYRANQLPPEDIQRIVRLEKQRAASTPSAPRSTTSASATTGSARSCATQATSRRGAAPGRPRSRSAPRSRAGCAS
jgi:hypothetical protein